MPRIKTLVLAAAGVLVVAGGALTVLDVTRDDRRSELTAALADLAVTAPEFSVAVLDETNGERFSYRGDEQFTTASVVKADVLACTLLRAQDEDRRLSAEQRELTARMIRASDNDATTALFEQLGAAGGLTGCNGRIGLEETTVDPKWGLSRTTADDQVRLLGDLAGDESPLGADSRRYALDLMSTVNADQDWGVPAVARDGETAAVKNGWDTSTADGGRWVVNSIGRVVSADRDTDVSIAVLSHGNASMADGIALVERVAGLTRDHLAY
ncbi:serine hydrolase [Actinoplanes sp. RD1]|uniref:serine hydrolase n=1 Tax=Actinoplanes sp. RD1 TaxID=3064538 RepID=UPI002740772B|nr:serine hydrolase [Actinoplanes sp. RD1]